MMMMMMMMVGALKGGEAQHGGGFPGLDAAALAPRQPSELTSLTILL